MHGDYSISDKFYVIEHAFCRAWFAETQQQLSASHWPALSVTCFSTVVLDERGAGAPWAERPMRTHRNYTAPSIFLEELHPSIGLHVGLYLCSVGKENDFATPDHWGPHIDPLCTIKFVIILLRPLSNGRPPETNRFFGDLWSLLEQYRQLITTASLVTMSLSS